MKRELLNARHTAFALIAVTVLAQAARAQSRPPVPTRAAAESGHAPRGWRASADVRLAETADDNVFLLPDTRKARLDSLSAAGVVSSRYRNMASSNDFITNLRAGGELRGPGLRGRELTLNGGARYEFYQRNGERRNVELRAGLTQSVRRGGQLQLRAELTPRYFYRDFMTDAVDQNGDGSIQSSERIYAAGVYRESEVAAGYRQRLVTPADDRGIAVRMSAELGYYSRSYQAPFATRGYRGPEATLGLGFDAGRTQLDASYMRGGYTARPGAAVLLLNEQDFNVDFNGNGSTTDSRVRSVQTIDASRTEQELSVQLRRSLTAKFEARGGLTHRWRSYGSSQPYDVYYNTRRDHRDDAGIALGIRLNDRLRMDVGGNAQLQKLARSIRPTATGEVTDYTRRRLFVSWSYHR